MAIPSTLLPPQNEGKPADMLAGLLTRISNHDRDAFAALYNATSMKLFGVILRILKRKPLAEDVLQEVYIKIWDKAGDFNSSRGSPIGWMATIARNRALDEVRSAVRLVSTEDVPDFDDIATSDPHALDQMERSEEYRRLTNCLNGLDDEKRKLVLLAYYEGFSRIVLGEKFGQPVSTIKTWLRRSLQSLKECLGT